MYRLPLPARMFTHRPGIDSMRTAAQWPDLPEREAQHHGHGIMAFFPHHQLDLDMTLFPIPDHETEMDMKKLDDYGGPYQIGPTLHSKTYMFRYFCSQYLVLLTMVPRNNHFFLIPKHRPDLDTKQLKQSLFVPPLWKHKPDIVKKIAQSTILFSIPKHKTDTVQILHNPTNLFSFVIPKCENQLRTWNHLTDQCFFPDHGTNRI